LRGRHLRHDVGEAFAVFAFGDVRSALLRCFSALGAERVSREFTDAELAAKEKYLRALKQETRLAGYSSFAGFEYAFDLNCLVIRSLSRITDDDLRLMIRAGRAAEEGQEATPEESAAVAKYIAEKTKCVHLAFGLLSAADLKEDPCQ
jgi:hypothetical protein